jgi:hypothetical protein
MKSKPYVSEVKKIYNPKKREEMQVQSEHGATIMNVMTCNIFCAMVANSMICKQLDDVSSTDILNMSVACAKDILEVSSKDTETYKVDTAIVLQQLIRYAGTELCERENKLLFKPTAWLFGVIIDNGGPISAFGCHSISTAIERSFIDKLKQAGIDCHEKYPPPSDLITQED